MKKSVAFILLSIALAAPLHAQGYRPVFEKITLENGLNIIFHRDTTLPVVSVNMAFHAGSAWDPKGKYGLANIAGTMLLTALPPSSVVALKRLENEGSVSYAGITNVDWTNLASTYPMQQLETALSIEADRMSKVSSSLTAEHVKNAVQYVVKQKTQEGKQKLADVQPRLYAELYPEGHQYRHVSTGDTTDLRSITQADVKKFLDIFMVPANASITIGGNFDLAQAKALARKYFAKIPGGKRMSWKAKDKELPPLGSSALIKEAPTDYSFLYILFATAPYGDPGEPGLKMLGQFLTGASDARLKKALLEYNQDVLDVSATQSSQELDGTFWVVVTCKPDARLPLVYTQIMNKLAGATNEDASRGSAILTDADKVKEDRPITPVELQMARNLSEMQFLSPLEKFYGFGGRCDVLNLANLYTGNPLSPVLAMQNQAEVTTFTLNDLMSKYFSRDHHVVMSIVPPGRRAQAVTLK
jgi:predicted Zn-dependent peptidase